MRSDSLRVGTSREASRDQEYRSRLLPPVLAECPYKEIEKRGLILVVTEVNCRYRAPYYYDDEVLIRTAISEAASRAMTFNYELRDATGERLHATGYSKHVWVDRETRRPTMADAEVMKAFEPFLV